jgi:hypothetical protein
MFEDLEEAKATKRRQFTCCSPKGHALCIVHTGDLSHAASIRLIKAEEGK